MTEDEMVGWHHQLNGHEFEQTLEMVKDREGWCAAVHGVTKSWTRLSDWTTILFMFYFDFFSHKVFGILAPGPGIKPIPFALEGQVPTTRLPRETLC